MKIIQIDLFYEKCKQEYLGLKLDKPYWIFVHRFPNGFMQTIHGLN